MNFMQQIMPFVYPYRFRIVAGFATFFIARFFEISTYYLVSVGVDLIDVMIRLPDQIPGYSIGQVALAICVTVSLRFVFVVHARREIRRTGIKVSFDMRERVFESVQRQGGEFFQRIGIGDIMTRAIQDISLIQRLIAFGLVQIVIMIYAPLFALSAMVFKSPSLTLLILPLMPMIFIYAYFLAKKLAVSSRNVQERLSDLGMHTQENLSGIRTVQAQAQEENEIRRFWQTNDAYAAAFYEQSRLNSLMGAWMPLFASLAQLAILVYGGSQVLEGEMSVGDLIFFFACLNMLLQPIRMAGFFVTMIQRSRVAMDRLYEIFDYVPEILDRPSHQTPDRIRGEFELKNLS